MTDNSETSTKKASWKRLKMLAEMLAIFVVVGLFAWPGAIDRTASTGAPTTQDTSGRVAQDVPTGTAGEADSLLADVRALDSTIAVDLRYRGTNNFTGAPLPGYEANRALMRREAAAQLAKVQRDLKADGLGLLIYDAYRPVRATSAMVAWTVTTHREALVTDGYISDRSKHNLGIAIDLTLIDLKTAAPLEMGTPFDTFSADAHTANATGLAAANRARFVAAMSREGFKNYDQEWWHFTFEVPPASLRRFDVPVR